MIGDGGRGRFLALVAAVALGWLARPAMAGESVMELGANAAAATAAPGGDLRVDIDGGAVIRQPKGPEKQVAASGEGGERGLEFVWDTAAAPYAEIIFNRQLPLPAFAAATVRARFLAKPGCPVNGVGLRLCDAGNETFQFSQSFHRSGDVVEVVWDVNAAVPPRGSWGVRIDHKFDMPVKVQGFALGYGKDVPQGKIKLLSMEVEIASGELVMAQRPLYTFDREDAFRRAWGAGEVAQAEDGLKVTGIRDAIGINERKDAMHDWSRPVEELVFTGRAVSGSVKIGAEFRDAANRKITISPAPLVDGKAVLDCRAALTGAAMPAVLLSVSVVNADKAQGPAEVVLRSASMTVKQPRAQAVDFALETGTGKRVRVLRPGAEKDLRLIFTNRALVANRVVAEVEYDGFNGERQREVYDLDLKPGEERAIAPAWKPASLGWWQAAATLRADGGSARVVRSLAYMRPSGPTEGRAPGFLFGVCTHTLRWSQADQEREIEAAALCGVKVARTGCGWERLQPAAGVWQWEDFDRLVDEYGRKGMELQAMFAFTPQWAAPEELQKSKNWLDWNRAAPRMDAWREYVRTVVGHYRGRIRFWEVWNEPDLQGFNHMTLDEYVERQKAAYEEGKKADPGAQIMTGGFATMNVHPGKKSPTFQRDFLVKAAGSYDVHAYHEHGNFLEYAQMVGERLLPMRREAKVTAPWYANETAMHSMGGAEREQASILFKKLLYAWSQGSIGYTWYDLRNDGYVASDPEHHYGMMSNDFYPKPVYCVYNMLTGLYGKARFVRRFDAPAPMWAFLFTDGADALVALWEEGGASAAARLVRSAATKVESIDMMGNATPMPSLDGLVLLPPSREPRTLRLHGVADADLAGTLVAAGANATAARGRPLRLTLQLANPLREAKEFVIAAEALPIGITVAGEREKRLTVAAGGTAPAELPLTVGEDFRPRYNESLNAIVNYAVVGTPWKGQLRVPINAALVIPRAGDKPDFVLNRTDQTFGYPEADPAMVHRLWNGPEDLSAEVRLAWEGGKLRVRASVVDDKHHQPDHGTGAWKGDSVQLAMELPGQSGFWELGLSRHDDGKVDVNVYAVPLGVKWEPTEKNASLKVEREGQRTVYEFVVDGASIGLTDAIAHAGFRFNLLVNENDGEGRDGWICIAPGIGDSKDPKKYPFVVFE